MKFNINKTKLLKKAQEDRVLEEIQKVKQDFDKTLQLMENIMF